MKDLQFCIYYWMRNLRDYVDRDVYHFVLHLLAYLWHQVKHEKKQFFNYSIIAAAVDFSPRQVRYYLDILVHLGLVKKEQCWVGGSWKLKVEFDYDNLKKILRYRSNESECEKNSFLLQRVLEMWNNCDNLIKHRKGTKLLEKAEDALSSLLSRGYTLSQIFHSIRNYDYLLGLEFSDINQELPGYKVGLDEFLGGFSRLTKGRMKRAGVKLDFKNWFEECLQARESLVMKWCKSFGRFDEEEKQLIQRWKDFFKGMFGGKKGTDKDWLFLARDWVGKIRHFKDPRLGILSLYPESWYQAWEKVLEYYPELKSDNPRKLKLNLDQIVEKMKELRYIL